MTAPSLIFAVLAPVHHPPAPTPDACPSRPPERGRIHLMDANGRGHIPGASAALKLQKVVVTRDHVWLWVVVDAKKHDVMRLGGEYRKIVAAENISKPACTRCRLTTGPERAVLSDVDQGI